MLYHFDGKQPIIGKDSYVSELANVIGDVIIGDNCYIGHGVILRGDYGRIKIEDGAAIEEGVIIHVFPDEICRVGEKVTIGHGAMIHSRNIDDFAVVGMGAILSIRSEIGKGTIIAEGGVVKQEQVIPEKVVAAGNPVRIVRKVMQRDMDYWDWGKQHYIDLAKRYLEIGMQAVVEK